MFGSIQKGLLAIRYRIVRMRSQPASDPASGPDLRFLEDRILYSGTPLAADLAAASGSGLNTPDALPEVIDPNAAPNSLESMDSSSNDPGIDSSDSVAQVEAGLQALDALMTQLDTLESESRSDAAQNGDESTEAPHVGTTQTIDYESDALQGNVSQSHELVVIDASIPDYESLLSHLQLDSTNDRGFSVLIVDRASDGLQQMSAALGESGVRYDAIHLVTHGFVGGMKIGNTELTSDNLDAYASQLDGWRSSLTDHADLFLYGCSIASGEYGSAFVRELASLLQVDIAASIDWTGTSSMGGDWVLEYRQGEIDGSRAFVDSSDFEWQILLTANNAPVLDAAASPSLGTVLEGAANPSGVTVSAMVVDGSVTDPDGSPVEAIAITGLNTSLGTWQYSLNSGTSWLTINAELINNQTNELALLLGPTAQLRLIPFGDLNGSLNDAITFRAWDQTSGTQGQYVVISATGGSTAFSSASDTAAITVTAVNDAPTFAPVAGTGKVLIPVGAGDDYSYSTIVQPDGRILLAGESSNGNGNDSHLSLIRLNADGSLDTSFDGDGKLILPWGSGHDYGYSVTAQSDGKIVVAGAAQTGQTGSDWDFYVVRLNTDGSLDTSFDGDGKLILPVGTGDEWTSSVTIQLDGRILVVGSSQIGSTNHFSVIRLNQDGSLDASFDGDGKLILPVGEGHDNANSITVQPDGRILVVGSSQIGSTSHFSVIRLNQDGSLDTSFDGDGKLILPILDGASVAYSVAVQLDGRILLSGIAINYGDWDFALIRLNSDGSLDTSFDGDGKRVLPVGLSTDYAYGMTIQPDGQILVTGSSSAGTEIDFSMVRLNSDGSLDASFDGDGTLILPVGVDQDVANGVIVQPDGRILAVLNAFHGSDWDFAMVRLNPDGSLDTTFGGAPTSTLGGTVSYTEGNSPVVLDSDVRVFDAELSSSNFSGATLTLVRNRGANPLDLFSATGTLGSLSQGSNLTVGGTMIGTVTTNSGGTLVLTFNSNATNALVNSAMQQIAYANNSSSGPVQINWTFSDGNSGAQGTGGALAATGSVTVNVNSVNEAPVLDAAASPTLGSVLEGATNPSGITVASLVVDGSVTDPEGEPIEAIAITGLNTSLGTWQYRLNGGTSWLTINAELINSQTNELALLLGPTAQLRLIPFGDLNGSLSDAITFRAWDMSSGSEGEYTVITSTGGATAFSAASDTASISVTAVNDAPTFLSGDGITLASFGGDIDEAYSVAVQPDGKIVIAGRVTHGPWSTDPGSQHDFALARFHADGSLDTSFGNGGRVITDISGLPGFEEIKSLMLQPDGKILVGGSTFNGTDYDYALARYNTDGSLDSTFGDGGTITTGSDANSFESLAQIMVQPDGKIVASGWTSILGNGNSGNFLIVRYLSDGSLDTSFGTDGKITTDVLGHVDQSNGATLQPDGKILVTGHSWNNVGNSYDLSIVRYDANGLLDTTFGTGGKVTTDIAGSDEAHSIFVQPDGKIVVAGRTDLAGYGFLVVRYDTDGTLDTTFGDGGKVFTNFSSNADGAASVTLQRDGKIVVAGYAGMSDFDHVAVARYNADGSMDNTFGSGGTVTTSLGDRWAYPTSVTIQPDGQIVVIASSWNSDGNQASLALLRYNADGSLDTSLDSANTLGETPVISYYGSPVILDSDVRIFDAELSSTNFSGATLTLVRHGGANSEDLFSATGTLGSLTQGGNLTVGGTIIGTVTTNSGGTLVLTFNSSASNALVNSAMQQIVYLNSSNAPLASVQIDWIFSDGNQGDQGAGGSAPATGQVTVLYRNAPNLDPSASPTLGTVLEGATNPSGVTVSAMVVDGSVTDPDGSPVEAIAITGLNTSLGTWQYSLNGGTTWLTINAELINNQTNELALLLGPTARLRLIPFGDLNGTLSDAITFRAWDMSSGNEGEYTVITSTGGATAFSTLSDTARMTVVSVDDAPTFAPVVGTGKLLVPVGAGDDFSYSVIVQPDCRILLAGESSLDGTDSHMSLIRLNSDGSLDTSFDGDGKLILPWGSGNDYGYSVTIQGDGKIIVGGSAQNGSDWDFYLVRLNTDGSLDTSFDGDGKLVLPLGDFDDHGHDVVVQPDGRILVAGMSWNDSTYDFAMIRLNADGSLDSSFDGDGKLILPVGVGYDGAYSVTVQSDGRILMSGESQSGGGFVRSLIRLNSDGSLDTSFDGDGQLLLPVGGDWDRGYSHTIQPDGRILLAGFSSTGSDVGFSLARLNSDGSLDTSFDGDGKLILSVATGEDLAIRVTIQPDGRILAVGYTRDGIKENISMIRLNSDGSLDPTFDEDGKLLLPVGASDDEGSSVVVLPDGRILVGGSSDNGSDWDFSLVRLNPDGSLDTTFNGAPTNSLGGTVSYTEGQSPVVLDSDVQIFDADLNSSTNFSGATLTLVRNGGANAQDLFSATGTLGSLTQGGNLTVGGTIIGIVTTNSGGTLVLTFNSSATEALVNSAMQQIAYANNGGSGTVQINWTFWAPRSWLFTDVTAIAGIGGDGNEFELSKVAQEAAWGDFDNDGDLDLYVTDEFSTNALYRNDGDGTFTDITVMAGISSWTGRGRDAAWGDYDNDGDLDLYIVNYIDGANALYRNNGDSTFTDVTATAGVGATSCFEDGSWADYDNDGDLDLFVADSWGEGQSLLYRNNGDGTFTDVTATAGVGQTGTDGEWGDYDNDGDLDLYITNCDGPNVLYRNNGNGTFIDVAASAGVANNGWSRQSSWGDYDNDGDLDLYVANGTFGVLYQNHGNGTFTDVTVAAGVVNTQYTDSDDVAWVDFDNDGDLDLHVFNYDSPDALYRNNGNGTFTNIATLVGLGISCPGQSSSWGDYDNDGDADLFITNYRTAGVLYRNEVDGLSAGQGAFGLTATGQVTVNITSVNDAPVLDAAASPTLGTVLEGATNPSGVTVAAMVVDASITDPDGSPVEAIAITGLNTSLGTWQYSLNGGTTWLTINAELINNQTNELALLLGPTAQLRLIPFGDLNGSLSDAITFRAWDMSSGSEGEYTVITSTGGATAFSTLSDTARMTVVSVDDAPTFAPVVGTGKLVVPVGSGDDYANSMTLLPDGRILVVGESFNGIDYDFSLIRLHADGSLDASFDGDGKLMLPFASGEDGGVDVVIQPDGKILVAGYGSNGSDWDYCLIRLNTDGSLDTTLDGDGKLILNVGSGGDFSNSVTIQPDGKILLAGGSQNGNYSDFSLVRLNTDGSLDTSFDGDGKLLLDIGGSSDNGVSLTVQPDGRILFAGHSWNGSNYDFSLIRLDTDGSLDTSFDGDGKLVLPLGMGNDAVARVITQGDGRILLVGSSSDGVYSDSAVIRLNTDGSLDTSFDGDGGLILNMGMDYDYAKGATIQPDGRILVVGTVSMDGNDCLYVTRLNPDGSLDSSFDGDGKVILQVGQAVNGNSIILQPDGRILVGGSSWNGNDDDFSLVRLNPDGSLDTTFNGVPTNSLGGTVSYTEGSSPVVLDSDVQIFDADLNGSTNFSGATLTLVRNGGANAQDLFSATGTLAALTQGGNLTVGGTIIGTVTTHSGGTLVLTFNSSATNALVNSAMQQIAYANSSDTPPANVQIDWTLSDGNSGAQGSGGALTATGAVTVNITSVNDAPVGVNDTATATEAGGTANGIAGTNPTGNVLTNDTDVDTGDTKAVSGVAAGISASASGSVGASVTGAYGSITIAADGAYTYIVDNSNAAVQALRTSSHTLSDVFTYTLQDAAGLTSTAQITVTIQGANDTPADITGSLTIAENSSSGSVVGTVVGQDIDLGETFTYSLTESANGRFAIHSSTGVVTVADSSRLDYEASTTHTITVRVTDAAGATYDKSFSVAILPVDEAPIVVGEKYATDFGTPLVLAKSLWMGNDYDPEGAELTPVLIAGPENGMVSIRSDGTLVYESQGRFVGTVFITYAMSDGRLLSLPQTLEIFVGVPNSIIVTLPTESNTNIVDNQPTSDSNNGDPATVTEAKPSTEATATKAEAEIKETKETNTKATENQMVLPGISFGLLPVTVTGPIQPDRVLQTNLEQDDSSSSIADVTDVMDVSLEHATDAIQDKSISLRGEFISHSALQRHAERTTSLKSDTAVASWQQFIEPESLEILERFNQVAFYKAIAPITVGTLIGTGLSLRLLVTGQVGIAFMAQSAVFVRFDPLPILDGSNKVGKSKEAEDRLFETAVRKKNMIS